MKVATIRQGLQTALETIDGLNVYRHGQASIDAPACLLVVTDVEYNASMGEATTRLARCDFDVVILIGKADELGAFELLDDYVASEGPRSVKVAVETDPTLGAAADQAFIRSVDQIGQVEVSGTDYFGVSFKCEVYGR